MLDQPAPVPNTISSQVEHTVVSYFQGVMRGEETSGFAAPDLALFDELGRAAAEAAGETILIRAGQLDSVRVLDIAHDGDDAVVQIEGWVRGFTRLPDGTDAQFDRDLSGEVVLQRLDGSWRIADYEVDKIPVVSAGFRSGSTPAVVAGVEIAAIALEKRRDASVLYLRVSSHVGDSAKITRLKTREPLRGLFYWGESEAYVPQIELARGEEKIVPGLFTTKTRFGSRTGIEVFVSVDKDKVSVTLPLRLEQIRFRRDR